MHLLDVVHCSTPGRAAGSSSLLVYTYINIYKYTNSCWNEHLKQIMFKGCLKNIFSTLPNQIVDIHKWADTTKPGLCINLFLGRPHIEKWRKWRKIYRASAQHTFELECMNLIFKPMHLLDLIHCSTPGMAAGGVTRFLSVFTIRMIARIIFIVGIHLYKYI